MWTCNITYQRQIKKIRSTFLFQIIYTVYILLYSCMAHPLKWIIAHHFFTSYMIQLYQRNLEENNIFFSSVLWIPPIHVTQTRCYSTKLLFFVLSLCIGLRCCCLLITIAPWEQWELSIIALMTLINRPQRFFFFFSKTKERRRGRKSYS